MLRKSDLSAFFAPRAVAVYGASQAAHKVGAEVFASLVAGGFAGELIPLNPVAQTICGRPTRASLSASGEKVDLAVVAVPRERAEEAVQDALGAQARAIVVLSAGFREAGEAGIAAEERLRALCHRHGARLLGPNCLGVINTQNRMCAAFSLGCPAAGRISLVSQSGALCTAIVEEAHGRGIGFAKIVSLGNKADLTEIDVLGYLAEDEPTGAIACYLEHIDNGAAFLEVAQYVSERKPLIVFKSGTSEAGSRAAMSHTGSLAGSESTYAAAFRRAGAIRARRIEELLDIPLAMTRQPLPAGPRVAIISNAGGPGIIAADALAEQNLVVAALTGATSAALRARLPRGGAVTGAAAAAAGTRTPVDVLGDADPERYAEAVRAAVSDRDVDGVLVVLAPQAMTRPEETAARIASAACAAKPIYAAFLGGASVRRGQETLRQAGVADFCSPERAALAFSAAWQYASWRGRPPREVRRFPVNRRGAERVLRRLERAHRSLVSEPDAKRMLRCYGFSVPEGFLADSADEAVAVAETLGFPVAVKMSSPDLAHKTDVGGVRLSIATPQAVRDTYDLFALRMRAMWPEAPADTVYVERMCPPGQELVVGVVRDPRFGPVLMFGLGGIFVEALRDVTFSLGPITADEARDMIRSTRAWDRMQGARGGALANTAAVAEALQRLSQIAADFPELAEIEINPLIVGGAGQPAWVVDARMTVSRPETPP
ncbi:MAG: acetate--CoA ligase family protein [Candidatus Schekmanbacteria bacterium]|nr:acetate--CoA ligase family protein [Candidatus Schekmanbacteria bacterium]